MGMHKDYIDDLTDFDGNLHELKQIVDCLYESYGWYSNVSIETVDNIVNFAVMLDTRH